MPVRINTSGSFSKTNTFFNRLKTRSYFSVLEKYGQMGVDALSAATPVESGETGESWYYEIEDKPGYFSIHWLNSHVNNGIPVAVLIQYGHGTKNGGYVQGLDYINPTLRPIFDQIADDMWREVTK